MTIHRQVEERASLLLYLEVGVRGRRTKDQDRRLPGSLPYRIVKKILWLNYSRVDVCLRTKPHEPGDICPQAQRKRPSLTSCRHLVEEEPSAPSLSLVLFNSEENSDLAFYVGPREGGQWRFPAHSFVVSPASPVLEAVIARCRSVLEDPPEPDNDFGGLVEDTKFINNICLITITETKPDIFESILRFVYTKKISFRSVSSCLGILEASLKFQVCDLSSMCLEYLSDNVTEINVLEVLSSVRRPSLGLRQYEDEDDNLRNELIHKCFLLIDENADTVLRSEAFENLGHPLLLEIASRDSLKASSETPIFRALVRWSCQECKRRRIELLAENKRRVLGPALYSVRFLSMTQDEFKLGPASSGILSESEQKSVLSRLNGDASAVLPAQLTHRSRDLPVSKSHASNSKGKEGCDGKGQGNQLTVNGKKPKRSRLLNGLGDIMIGVFTLLD